MRFQKAVVTLTTVLRTDDFKPLTVTLVKIHFPLGSHMKMNMPRILGKFKPCYLQEISHVFAE